MNPAKEPALKSKRIEWIDVAKGLAITLMYWGHAPCIPRPMYEIIFSFHMPLFFVLTGYIFPTNPKNSLREEIRKGFHRLFIPYLLLALVEITIRSIGHFSGHMSLDMLTGKILGTLYGNCSRLDLNGIRISGMGPVWFLVTLFWARIIFYAITASTQQKPLSRIGLVLCVSIAGWGIGQFFVLPQGIDIAAASIGFMYAGQLMKRHGLIDTIKTSPPQTQAWSLPRIVLFCSCIAIWSISFLGAGLHLNLAGRGLPGYPLVYLAAIAGSLITMMFASRLSNTPFFCTLFNLSGSTHSPFSASIPSFSKFIL